MAAPLDDGKEFDVEDLAGMHEDDLTELQFEGISTDV